MSTDNDVIEKQKVKLEKPKKWAVVLHNDAITPMDFVVELLHYVFHMDVNTATELMIKIHTEDKGVAGVYSFEIAEQKHAEAVMLVQAANFDLKISLEEE